MTARSKWVVSASMLFEGKLCATPSHEPVQLPAASDCECQLLLLKNQALDQTH